MKSSVFRLAVWRAIAWANLGQGPVSGGGEETQISLGVGAEHANGRSQLVGVGKYLAIILYGRFQLMSALGIKS